MKYTELWCIEILCSEMDFDRTQVSTIEAQQYRSISLSIGAFVVCVDAV